jgi:hypothetical protein
MQHVTYAGIRTAGTGPFPPFTNFEPLKTRRYADLKKLGGENGTGSYCGRPVFVKFPYTCNSASLGKITLSASQHTIVAGLQHL